MKIQSISWLKTQRECETFTQIFLFKSDMDLAQHFDMDYAQILRQRPIKVKKKLFNWFIEDSAWRFHEFVYKEPRKIWQKWIKMPD